MQVSRRSENKKKDERVKKRQKKRKRFFENLLQISLLARSNRHGDGRRLLLFDGYDYDQGSFDPFNVYKKLKIKPEESHSGEKMEKNIIQCFVCGGEIIKLVTNISENKNIKIRSCNLG